MSASPPDGEMAQSVAAMTARSVERPGVEFPVPALTMSAPGATPRHVALLLAIAPATQVGWMWVTMLPVVLYRSTTCPARSPVFEAFAYSTTATRTPLP